MAFIDLYRELQGTFPDLPEAQAQRFINRAQRDAYDAWNWSFLAGEGSLNIPAAVSTGTITVTQNSQVVVANAAAAAVWVALGLFIPITTRSLKISTDQPYNILAFDGVDTVYIDRPFTGEDDTDVTYSMYRPYYAAPTDFQRWVSVVDTNGSWNLIPGKKKEWLDRVDPQRNMTGTAQFVSFYMFRRAQTIPIFGANAETTPIAAQNLFELWPAPTAEMSLSTYYKKRGADLVEDTDESPFDDGLLVSRALYHCYRFVQVNAVKFSQVKDQRTDWRGLKVDTNADYMYELGNAVKRDDNVSLNSIIKPAGNWSPSSSWLTKHLTWAEMSQAYAGYY